MPEYERFDDDAGFQRAVDRLLALEGRELRVFDPDLEALRLDARDRVRRLEAFLRASRARRLYIAVHDPDRLTRRLPRMMALIARHAHAVAVHRTHEEIRHLQDAFLVLDAAHYVRRPVAAWRRGAIGVHDEAEAIALRGRFLEIWAASEPAVAATTLGL